MLGVKQAKVPSKSLQFQGLFLGRDSITKENRFSSGVAWWGVLKVGVLCF